MQVPQPWHHKECLGFEEVGLDKNIEGETFGLIWMLKACSLFNRMDNDTQSSQHLILDII